MKRYHHYGIPTSEKKANEGFVEVGNFKFYTTPFEANKWHFQWHRFPEGHGLPELVTKVPHLAFQVDNLDEEIKECKILFGPYSPIEGYRVAMIEEQGIPIELVETSLSDNELASLEKKKLENDPTPSQNRKKQLNRDSEYPLSAKHCVPCRGGVPPLEGDSLTKLLKQLEKGWKVINEHHLEKEYSFKNFQEGLLFTNRIGEIAEQEGHHPDIVLTYGKVKVMLWTHKIDGLTESDFILAAKCDDLL